MEIKICALILNNTIIIISHWYSLSNSFNKTYQIHLKISILYQHDTSFCKRKVLENLLATYFCGIPKFCRAPFRATKWIINKYTYLHIQQTRLQFFIALIRNSRSSHVTNSNSRHENSNLFKENVNSKGKGGIGENSFISRPGNASNARGCCCT